MSSPDPTPLQPPRVPHSCEPSAGVPHVRKRLQSGVPHSCAPLAHGWAATTPRVQPRNTLLNTLKNRSTRFLLLATLTTLPALALLPPWLQHIRSGAAFESALYRLMDLPGTRVFFPRPPKESIAELNKLPPTDALYSLRAHQEEQALDFSAAESDWKLYAAKSLQNRFQLADFYHKRHLIQPEIDTLLAIATAPATADPFLPTAQQPAWRAFERTLKLLDAQSLDDTQLWRAWIARYPNQPTVYARAFTQTLDKQRLSEADSILAAYRKAFPADPIFTIKATALLALQHGGPEAQTRALSVYDAAFQPLWPDTLVSSYLALLESTHNLRHFTSDAKARLQRNPDDLNALARLFLYQQHVSQPALALATLDTYRRSNEVRNAPWTAAELDTLAQLSLRANDPASAARFDFALYNHNSGSQPVLLSDGRPARETGLANMVALLLSTPEQTIALGAGNLSMYRDIATLDRGPGLWNGVLSLWFNGQSPQDKFAEEERKAQPYFQRAKAAELLALLDSEAPTAPQRPALHAQLLQVYADYGDNAAVLREGTALLGAFPNAGASFRLSVALATADAYARQNDTTAEFALYDRTLQELAAATQHMPLTAAAAGRPPAITTAGADDEPVAPTTRPDAATAFQLDTGAPAPEPHPEANAYTQVLDRYLGRLTTAKKLPEALAVLRKELDRNPNDPLLYEKLASFLQQNNLSAQQEEVYRRAIEKFDKPGANTWTDKLARYYLRAKRDQDYATLSRKVADTFEGTDLDTYFRQNTGGGAQLALQLNLYAHQRFPHDLVFTRNLLSAYTAKGTADPAAHEKLLREIWWQSADLTRQFFELLSRTDKLDAELAQLQPSATNPAAQQEAAGGELWRSHFEQSAPLYARLSAAYPADTDLGTTASDLQRSLAWFDLSHTAESVSIEQRLLSANPTDTLRLARVGDILADHADDSSVSLAASAQYWRRIATVAPGNRDGYLQAATVFWDYFQFDDALAQIAAARAHFHQATLFGYEAGAIAEGKRDYPLAVREYVAAATSPTPDDNAASRLVQLARRASTRDLVDAQTAAATSSADPAALTLRLKVLATQKRSAEAAPLLTAALKSAKTADDAASIGDLARSHQLPAIYEQALARQADLAADPVERLQLRYALARAYEDRNDTAAAARIIDALYHDNPMLLGVVRSTVDFDWRTKRQPAAIAVLIAAARDSHAAQPALANQFTAEAAAKANESGDTQQARALADSLLQQAPYNAQYLALAADSYARSHDNAGLQRFYLARLDTLKTASMSNGDRKTRSALLRRGLIPALSAANDYEGATAQYIALLSAYPEDNTLNDEAALYALRYKRREQYLGFLQSTILASPRDSRFFIDLAQAQAIFGDLPAAIDAYAHAIAIRKDRTDLYMAKAALEETLQRFDEAVADDQRLYQLTYKDPQWMLSIARLRARQGRASDAADALKTAYLSGPKKLPRDFFQIASQLEQWNFLPEAATFAEQGRAAAGSSFLTADETTLGPDDPATYGRILTRQRQSATAISSLRQSLAAAAISPSSPTLIAAQAQAEGIASVTDADWRKQQAAARKQQAEATFARTLTAIGSAVDTFYTPEERTTYAALLAQQRIGTTPKQLASVWIPAAHAAGLFAKEAAWRKELLLAPGSTDGNPPILLIELQRSRLLFGELGQTLEAYARTHPKFAPSALTSAAEAYRSSGDFTAEARVLRQQSRDETHVAGADRYLDLLLHRDTATLVTLAASRTESLSDAAANLALQKAPIAVALAAIRARGQALPAVWTPASTALTYLYLADTTGQGDAAFRSVLADDATISTRIAIKPNPATQLTGELWFYYAARNAQLRFLSPATHTAAEDLAAADLEYAATPANYKALAQTYAEAGDTASALAELDHVLELDPSDAATYDARATLLWNLGRKAEALAAWRKALASLRILEDRAAAPESFWSSFALIARHVHAHNIFAETRPQIDDVLRIYLARNGNYRSNELLHAAFDAAPTPDDAATLLISLISAAADPLTVYQDLLANAAYLPSATRERLLLAQIRIAQTANAGPDDYTRSRVLTPQTALIHLYAEAHKDAKALALLRSLTPAQRNTAALQQTEAVLAARSGQLDALLAAYRSDPDTAPPSTALQAAAAELSADNHPQPARALLEFSFDRSRATNSLAATDYLALAEARLRTNDLEGALTLLHSLTQSTSGDTYTNLDSAAALFERNARPAESIPFLRTLAGSVPWDFSYSVRLAEARQHAKQSTPEALASLTAVARNPLAAYALRTRAARDLAGNPSDLGGAELTLLTSSTIAPAAARQPFFVAARATAAAQSHDAKLQTTLLREAIAIAPNSPQMLLALFHAEVNGNNTPGSHAALEALLSAHPTTSISSLNSANAASSNDESDNTQARTDYAESITATDAPLPAIAATLPAAERAQLAADFAAIYSRDGEDAPALAYLNLAIRLAPQAPNIAALRTQIAVIESAQRLAAANVARSPMLHKTLYQANFVRSRLTVLPDDPTPIAKEVE